MQLIKQSFVKTCQKLAFVGALSIKQLTLLGFTLVALPLVIALLYSANQVGKLSQQGASAIYKVAELVNTGTELGNTLKKMERSLSQYLVLHDDELKQSYLYQHQLIIEANQSLRSFDDEALNKLSYELSQATDALHQKVSRYLVPEIEQQLSEPLIEPTNLTAQYVSEQTSDKASVTKNITLSLEDLQQDFLPLINIQEQIKTRGKILINQQASQIKNSTEQISQTLFKSVVIIPFSLLIGAVFIVLITNPLKQLTYKIQRFQKGNFHLDHDLSEDTPPLHEKNIPEQTTNLGVIEIREIHTALDTMRARLHALELQKSSFIRHISHDLKTPLAAIREGTELLYDHSVGQLNDEQQEIAKIIRDSTTRLQLLIEELLDFNIVLDSTSLQDREHITLTPLIEQVITERALEIKRKQLLIEKQFSEPLKIISNSKQLKVIIDNILSNAIKYSPVHGVITIMLKRENQDLLITVSDRGVGISRAQQEKIFDAFYQGAPSPDALESHIKSSGLGLTIVKELLMRLDGDILVNSTMQSPSGTTMSISLPRVFIGES